MSHRSARPCRANSGTVMHGFTAGIIRALFVEKPTLVWAQVAVVFGHYFWWFLMARFQERRKSIGVYWLAVQTRQKDGEADRNRQGAAAAAEGVRKMKSVHQGLNCLTVQMKRKSNLCFFYIFFLLSRTKVPSSLPFVHLQPLKGWAKGPETSPNNTKTNRRSSFSPPLETF